MAAGKEHGHDTGALDPEQSSFKFEGTQLEYSDVVRLRDIVLTDPIALRAWPQIIDHVVQAPADVIRIKQLVQNTEYAEAVLQTLQLLCAVKDGGVDLMRVLRHHNQNAVADQIEKQMFPTLSSRLPKVGVQFQIGEVEYNFTGRVAELEKLQALFKKVGSRVAGQSVLGDVIWIAGLGGVGKSSLARKYAFDRATDFDGNVAWMHASTQDSLRNSFTALAKRLKIPVDDRAHNQELAGNVYEYFETKKSLFIFDNVEELKLLQDFMPRATNVNDRIPSLLVTSRRNDFPVLKHVFELGVLSNTDATKFVRNELNESTVEEWAQKLATKLQYFPLALQQATAYIKEVFHPLDSDCVKEYLDKFISAEKELLNDERFKGCNDYSKTTYATWHLTMLRIGEKEGGGAAVGLLVHLSYLSPDYISFVFLASLVLEGVKESARLLHRFSMIDMRENGVKIHRLVQSVIRLDQSEASELAVVELILCALGKWETGNRLASNPLTTRFKLKNECISHGLFLFPHQMRHPALYFKKDCFLHLDQLCFDLNDFGNHSDALSVALQSSWVYEPILGKDHMETLLMKWRIADAHVFMMDLPKAQAILNTILPLCGPEHAWMNRFEFVLGLTADGKVRYISDCEALSWQPGEGQQSEPTGIRLMGSCNLLSVFGENYDNREEKVRKEKELIGHSNWWKLHHRKFAAVRFHLCGCVARCLNMCKDILEVWGDVLGESPSIAEVRKLIDVTEGTVRARIRSNEFILGGNAAIFVETSLQDVEALIRDLPVSMQEDIDYIRTTFICDTMCSVPSCRHISHYSSSIYAKWAMTFPRLFERWERKEGALMMASVLAHLNHKHIGVEFVTMVRGEATESDLKRLTDLQVVQVDDGMVRIHPCVQFIVRQITPQETQDLVLTSLVGCLSAIYDSPFEPKSRGSATPNLVSECTSHGLHLFQFLQEQDARLWTEYSRLLHIRASMSGRNEEALALGLQATRKLASVLGPHHLDTLRMRRGVANSYYAMGNYRGAVLELHSISSSYRSQFGDEHALSRHITYLMAETYSAILCKAMEALKTHV